MRCPRPTVNVAPRRDCDQFLRVIHLGRSRTVRHRIARESLRRDQMVRRPAQVAHHDRALTGRYHPVGTKHPSLRWMTPESHRVPPRRPIVLPMPDDPVPKLVVHVRGCAAPLRDALVARTGRPVPPPVHVRETFLRQAQMHQWTTARPAVRSALAVVDPGLETVDPTTLVVVAVRVRADRVPRARHAVDRVVWQVRLRVIAVM